MKADKPRGINGSRISIFIILLIAFITVFAFAAYYFVYRQQVSQLAGYKRFYAAEYQAPVYPKLTNEQILNLGWAHRKKENKPDYALVDPKEPKLSYIHFQFEKKAGIFRIGIFGDSFTEGVEAGHGFDYPSLLQENFDKADFDSIEVINFGIGGYGVHQAYLLFEYLGNKYNLDVIILQPFFFHYTRDNSFTYEHDYLPVHARFILENDELKLLDVLGSSMEETADIYHRFFPKMQYLKYDIKTPNFLKPIFPDYNPFYYTGAKNVNETRKEILETYSLILDALASKVKQVVIVCHNKEIYELKEKVTEKNITFFQSQITEVMEASGSLYKAPVEHFSPLGNQFVADELFNFFSGKNDSLSFIRLSLNDTAVNNAGDFPPLHNYDSVFFRIEQSDFHLYTRQGQEASNVWSIPFDLKKSGTNSFLLLSDKLSQVRLLPLSFIPKDGDKISISTDTDRDIGRLVSVNPYVFRIVLTDTLLKNNVQEEDNIPESITGVFTKDAKLIFGENELPGNPYEAVVRSQGEEYFDLRNSGESGEMMMVIKKGTEEKLFSFLKWNREKISALNSNYISPQ